jgi:hypothetical protein
MALPAVVFAQRDFSGGQVTVKAARRDDLAIQRAGLRRYVNARPLATGALAQRFGRSVYDLDEGRTEIVRFSDTLRYEFLFGDGILTVRNIDGDVVNTFGGLPWSLDTVNEVELAVAERDVFLGFRNNRPKHLRLGTATLIDTSAGMAFGDFLADLAFPTVAAFTNPDNNSVVTTNHNISLPAANPGDLYLLAFRTAGDDVTHTTPDGWTLLATRASSGRTSIFWKEATGADTNPTIVSSASRRAAYIVHRLINGTEIEGAFAASNTIDPPSLSPTWGSSRTEWIALATCRANPSGTGTAPSGYSTVRDSDTGNPTSSTSHCVVTRAGKLAEASSDNPGTFGNLSGNDSPHAATVAVRPNDATELGKAFDGVFSKAAASCATKDTDDFAIIGIDFGAGNSQAVGGVTLRGSNDAGFVAGATPEVTIKLFGKDTVPTEAEPGTELGDVVFTDTANELAGRSITSSDTTTLYRYLAVTIEHDGSDADIYIAQVTFDEPAPEDDAWEMNNFVFEETPAGAKKQPYYKFVQSAVSLQPSARSGAVTLTFSDPVLDAEHVGVSFRYHGREIQVTAVSSATSGTGTVIDVLPPTMRVICASANQRNSIRIGEVVVGATSGSEGLVVAYNSTVNLDVIVFTGDNFTDTEFIVSPSGRAVVTGTPSEQSAAATPVWDEAVMSDFRGWPSGLEWDRSRLIMCNFPQLPRAIVWSAIGAPRDMLVGAAADDAFFEFASGNGRVLHVVGGADQYVLTDIGVMYIPISEASPLIPGSVAFRPIAAIGSGIVQPVSMHEGIVYATANRKSLIAIIPTGQTSFPYRTLNISEFHADLFTGVRSLAAMTGGGEQAEQYLWASQDDGTAVTGKFNPAEEWVGFVSVTSEGLIKWITALAGEVLFNVLYDDLWTMETLDPDQYLDCAVPLNQPFPTLRPDPEDETKGRLWFLAGETVDIMEGTDYLGARVVDEDGFIVEETGDDFSGATVSAGFGWTVDISPWLPNKGEGDAMGQRLRRRRVKMAGVTVQDTGAFTFIGRAFGGDAATVSGTFRAHGQRREFEPECRLTKTTPGPLLVTELAGEVTV